VNELIFHSTFRTVGIAAGRSSTRAFARCLAATVVLTAARTLLAQDALIAARDLYRAAAYEEALRWATNVDEFKLKVQGITTTVDMSRDQMARTVVGEPAIVRFGS